MQEKLASFSIKNWADDDRPREKLVQKGSFVLSDAELIAILIGSGSRDESAVELSKRILASVDNNLNELGKLSVNQLMRFKGIGEAKAEAIVAYRDENGAFASVESLTAVKGIGASTLSNNAGRIVLE